MSYSRLNGPNPGPSPARRPLRVGFVPLCDCAPLVMAQELGLFNKHGVRVHLSREVGWATLRDKMVYRELDAAHALAPMVFAASLGLGSPRADFLTGLVLSLDGTAITLTKELHEASVRKGDFLDRHVRERQKPLVMAIPFLYSSHHFLLRAWLRAHGLAPGRDVQLVVVPPPQMPANLKAGHLDGYCVGEPWNSFASLAGFGWRAPDCLRIAPKHPEKVLMVRGEFAASRSEEHLRLIAALVESCQFCAVPTNRERIVETLGEPQYVNAPAAALRDGLELVLGPRVPGDISDHEPSADKAAWVLGNLCESGLLPERAAAYRGTAAKVFRADIFQSAIQPHPSHETKLQPARSGH